MRDGKLEPTEDAYWTGLLVMIKLARFCQFKSRLPDQYLVPTHRGEGCNSSLFFQPILSSPAHRGRHYTICPRGENAAGTCWYKI